MGLRRERRRREDEKWMEKEASGRWRTFMKVGEREREITRMGSEEKGLRLLYCNA